MDMIFFFIVRTASVPNIYSVADVVYALGPKDER